MERAWEWAVLILVVVIAFAGLAYLLAASGGVYGLD